ncbi:MAG: hypothetical protein IAE79_28310 [Anaerolinea sp.]|nr:hypothetical protein [Anaerolinea sp.]
MNQKNVRHLVCVSLFICVLVATMVSCRNSDVISTDGRLTVTDFAFLEFGMSYDEVKRRIGPADRDVGSGLYIYVYDLGKDDQVILTFATLDHLLSAKVTHADGSVTDLVISSVNQ